MMNFSLAEDTNINAESYDYPKLIIAAAGNMTIFTDDGRTWDVNEGESFLIDEYIPFGMRTGTGCVYTEIGFGRRTK